MEPAVRGTIPPELVQPLLTRHMLTKSMMPMVLDMEKSRGCELFDQLTGKRFLDFFGFYASSPLGMNHPGLLGNAEFLARLQQAAINKITNSDVFTEHKARFVRTFSRVGIPPELPHLFFVSGGALAVENALKAAFDWKVRLNQSRGRSGVVGQQVMHFREAFHGRTGYTMSLTNTDPRKTDYFPKFDWPRISNPKLRFPLTEEGLENVQRAEARAIEEAKEHFRANGDDIACIIIEPIQGEGGDNHFRPEFLARLRELADENDALLIFDEVQTGVGITGSFWAYQSLGVQPDIISFGKKTQVCGILASTRLDEVADNVFQVPSRINSTWGGNLVDMVRFDRILEVIEEDELLDHVRAVGAHLLGRLEDLQTRIPVVTNVRGKGLMCAFDMPDTETRDAVLKTCYEEGVVILGCGVRSIRFRTPLTISTSEIDEGLDRIERSIRKVLR
ncbi:MAG TPA: L-lysine 6-transaminase [Rhodothermales bacterium]